MVSISPTFYIRFLCQSSYADLTGARHRRAYSIIQCFGKVGQSIFGEIEYELQSIFALKIKVCINMLIKLTPGCVPPRLTTSDYRTYDHFQSGKSKKLNETNLYLT